MVVRKQRWAVSRVDGDPVLLDGVIVNIDEQTGEISLDNRTREVMQEILANDPRSNVIVPVQLFDFAEEVNHLIETKRAAGIPTFSKLPKDGTKGKQRERNSVMDVGEEAIPQEFQQTIDQALRLVFSQLYRYRQALVDESSPKIFLEELRQGPLGADLRYLARIAAGESDDFPDKVLQKIDSI